MFYQRLWKRSEIMETTTSATYFLSEYCGNESRHEEHKLESALFLLLRLLYLYTAPDRCVWRIYVVDIAGACGVRWLMLICLLECEHIWIDGKLSCDLPMYITCNFKNLFVNNVFPLNNQLFTAPYFPYNVSEKKRDTDLC